MSGLSFDALEAVPAGGYASDPADGSDPDTLPDFVVSTGETSWYAYDVNTHRLSPRPIVYAVKTTEGAYYKFAVLGYYNDDTVAGHVSVQWRLVSPPRE